MFDIYELKGVYSSFNKSEAIITESVERLSVFVSMYYSLFKIQDCNFSIYETSQHQQEMTIKP